MGVFTAFILGTLLGVSAVIGYCCMMAYPSYREKLKRIREEADG